MFSATQIENFLLCPRRWGWDKIDRIPRKPNAALELGLCVHAQIENWLAFEIPFDFTHKSGEIAYSGRDYLPHPRTPGMQVEEMFVLEMGGHQWIGLKDIQILKRPGCPPLVVDHKTTKDVSLYAKSPDELRENVQACLYAADAMVRADSESCELVWIYYQTQGARKAHPVRLTVTRDDVEPTLRRVCEAADTMAAIRAAGLTAKDLPPNVASCDAFGGCPYVDHCNLTIGDLYMAQQSENSFLAKLKAAKAAAPAGPPPGPPPGAPAINPPAHDPPPPQMPPPTPPRGPNGEIWDGKAWVMPPPPPPPPAPTPAAAKAAFGTPLTRAELADIFEGFVAALRG